MPEIKKYLTTLNHSKGRSQLIKFLAVHYTYGAITAAGAALANCKYFASGDRGASAHYFIDDGPVIWQSVEDRDTAWSVGSHTGVYKHPTARNSNTISIEVCTKGAFTELETVNLEWLVKKKMAEYNIPASNVIRHYDITGKLCPVYYVDAARWGALHKRITEEAMPKPVPKEPVVTYRIVSGWAANPASRKKVEDKCAALSVKCVVDGPLFQFHANLDKTKQIEAVITGDQYLYRTHAIIVPQEAYRAMGVAKGSGVKNWDVKTW